jgi:hypothetical protein
MATYHIIKKSGKAVKWVELDKNAIAEFRTIVEAYEAVDGTNQPEGTRVGQVDELGRLLCWVERGDEEEIL